MDEVGGKPHVHKLFSRSVLHCWIGLEDFEKSGACSPRPGGVVHAAGVR